jgi:radixin
VQEFYNAWVHSHCLQEREALEAQVEVERRMAEARLHEEESRRLQAELENARREMEENQRALQEALASPKYVYIREHDDDAKNTG